MKYLRFLPIFIVTLVAASLTACIEDGFTTSPADQPEFSSDTLKMGETYTLYPTPTRKFTIYNRHNKQLNISSISLRDDADNYLRLNIDGVSGRSFSNVEIRPNDSIFVFVEATLPEMNSDAPVEFNRHLDLVTNSVTRTVVISLTGQDVVRLDNYTVNGDETLTANRPYLITDTLRVAQGATLRIAPGARLRFRTDAAMKVEGTLLAEGTPEKPIDMTGDRTGNVASNIPYELMSGQWGGIYFGSTSEGNRISYASIRNSCDGLTLAPSNGSTTVLTMVNSQVRNSSNYIIDANHASTVLLGCELTDASSGILRLNGGHHIINHCTISNNYLFTALGGPAIQFEHIDGETDDPSGRPFTSALITNSIIYGLGTELSHGDLTGMNVTLNRCLLKSAGTDDDNFINCLWDVDPLFYTVRSEYLFDYRLQPESPAIGASDPALDIYGLTTDRYGLPLASPADLGAYTFTPPTE